MSKCFIPQAWMHMNTTGISAFLHPDGVYDDPKGGMLRRELYSRLRYHFMFENEKKLFSEIHGRITYSINICGNPKSISFDSISMLYVPDTIDQCYDETISTSVGGQKNEKGDWNVNGHPDRIIHISSRELKLFSKIFDNEQDWHYTRLPVLHCTQVAKTLECFANQARTLGNLGKDVFTTQFWNETIDQTEGVFEPSVGFPERPILGIYSSAQIGRLNLNSNTTRREYRVNSDYDRVDPTIMPDDYMVRVKYRPACDMNTYMLPCVSE